jgi:hypothetical protein
MLKIRQQLDAVAADALVGHTAPRGDRGGY